jgi:hypothetical protein
MIGISATFAQFEFRLLFRRVHKVEVTFSRVAALCIGHSSQLSRVADARAIGIGVFRSGQRFIRHSST